jgi:geranylgeranyl diphosphate synthase type II
MQHWYSEWHAARIHAALEVALGAAATSARCPPRLSRALTYAVFPGGGRLRPQLCLAVADMCGDPDPALADAMAIAIELVHCASLAHDDMPCFDDAATRRGRPSVHRAFGEPTALLVGDALIVLAFETLARAAHDESSAFAALRLTRVLAAATGAERGIVAGQAWELEPDALLAVYHHAKTASLFEAATIGGAIACGAADDAAWARFGRALGGAYQVIDDIVDATGEESVAGKPVGRDAALDRPSAVRELGLEGARSRAREKLEEAMECLPSGPAGDRVRAWVRGAVDPRILRSVAA